MQPANVHAHSFFRRDRLSMADRKVQPQGIARANPRYSHSNDPARVRRPDLRCRLNQHDGLAHRERWGSRASTRGA